jgi:hypothetical protein
MNQLLNANMDGVVIRCRVGIMRYRAATITRQDVLVFSVEIFQSEVFFHSCGQKFPCTLAGDIFKKIFFSICVGVSSACMSVYHVCPWWDIRSPEIVVADNCEPVYRCWKLNPKPLEEQTVILTAEPSLQFQMMTSLALVEEE